MNNSVSPRFLAGTSMIQWITRICDVEDWFLWKSFWFFLWIFSISGLIRLRSGRFQIKSKHFEGWFSSYIGSQYVGNCHHRIYLQNFIYSYHPKQMKKRNWFSSLFLSQFPLLFHVHANTFMVSSSPYFCWKQIHYLERDWIRAQNYKILYGWYEMFFWNVWSHFEYFDNWLWGLDITFAINQWKFYYGVNQ